MTASKSESGTLDRKVDQIVFDHVIAREKVVIAAQRVNRGADAVRDHDGTRVYGLALSGGGIRSASFALGVLQSLHKEEKLKCFDYLSTVSGGGYIGGSLTWFHHLRRQSLRKNGDTRPMTKAEYEFPFGHKYFARRAMENPPSAANSKSNAREADMTGAAVSNAATARASIGAPQEAADNTAFLRHLGNYLSHGAEVSTLSLLAVLLRNMLITFAVYFSIVLAGTLLLTQFSRLIRPEPSNPFTAALVAFGLFAALCVVYGWASWLYSKFLPESNQLYRWRIRSQRLQGWLLTAVLLCLIAGSIPTIYGWLEDSPKIISGTLTTTSIGAVLLELFKQRRPNVVKILGRYGSLLALLGVGAMIYSLLLGAYALAQYLDQTPLRWWLPALLVVGSILVGGFLNLNLFGLGRMYRDRIMETFMPNRKSVEKREWALATEADVTFLKDVCGMRDFGPFHIINSNVVLTTSNSAEYRGRGGDNFTMSSEFCGGDATGWHKTEKFLGGTMSLPTAVAISGAALNPNSACTGDGFTRSRLSSFLLGLFNLRLGYWVRNPLASPSGARLAKLFWPNLIYPGVRQGLLGSGMDERAGFVELTDGGHFENTGVYELIRRGVDTIVLSLASADSRYRFDDLADVIERVRVDFGVYIHFRDELDQTLPQPFTASGLESALHLSERGHAVATIDYPNNGFYGTAQGAAAKTGKLIVLKAAILKNLPLDVVAYGARHADFPNQTTADQYFDERQFEAYREAGYSACKTMLRAGALASA